MASEGKNAGMQVSGLVLGAVGAVLVGKGVVTGEGGWWDLQAYLGYACGIGCVVLATMGGSASARAIHAVGGLLYALGLIPVGIILATPESQVGLLGIGGGVVAIVAGLGLLFAGDNLKKK